MRNLVSAIQNRDAGTLARLAGDGPQPVDRGVHEDVEKLVDALFSNLKQVFPASVSTAWKRPEDEAAAKRQWIAAFAENGIHNRQQLSAGMREARASGSPFLPSPGQFITWCKDGESRHAGLPDADEGALLGTGAARAAQQDARQGIVQSYQNKFGAYAPEAVIDSLQRGVRAEKNSAGELLSQISTQMQGRAVPASKTLASLDSAITDLNKLGSLKDTGAVNALEGLRSDLQKAPVSYDDFRNLRSAFRDGVKGDNIAMRGRTEAIIDRVYKSMSDDLTSSVGRALGSDTASKYAVANSSYGNLANRVKNTALKRVLEKGEYVPEVVNSVVYSSKPSEVRNLYSLLDEKGKDAMRAAYISKIAEKSGDSPAKFMSEVNRLRKNPAINDVLGARHVKELNGLMDVLRMTSRADSASVVTQTGQALANPVRLGSAVVSQGSSLAAEAGYGLMTRVYESKPVRNALLRLANTKAGTPSYEKALDHAALMIRPIIANSSTPD